MEKIEISAIGMDKRTLARRIKQFNTLQLVGVSDIAKALNWDKAKVTVYVKRGNLPEPLGEVSGRPVWMYEQVRPYIERYNHDRGN